MTQITKDPKRRIRRIQRWTRAAIASGGMAPHASCLHKICEQHWRNDQSLDMAAERINEANAMFAKESAWLCDYALRITTDHGRATSRLGEVEWALAMCRVAVQTVVSGISSNSTPDTVSVLFESVCSELKTLRAERNCKS